MILSAAAVVVVVAVGWLVGRSVGGRVVLDGSRGGLLWTIILSAYCDCTWVGIDCVLPRLLR